ncbi:DUF305 domain-containing protein [Planomonospora alba]|uniref:DUF305 domain-containing protein n=1 Tax=Planomonospora alba TaxID=161354 RepID=UPI0031E8EA9E
MRLTPLRARLTPLRRNVAIATAVAVGAVGVPVTIAWSTSSGNPGAVMWTAPNVAAAPGVAAAPRHRHGDHGSGLQPFPTPTVAYEFGESLAELEGEELEIAALAQMIPHHRAGVEMSRLEVQRGVDPRIRTHAENIVAFQGFQVQQLVRWLREWYGLTPEQAVRSLPRELRQEIAEAEEHLEEMLDELRETPAGRRFDVEFVRWMIPHHVWGIVTFLEAATRAVHPELRVAASTVNDVQQFQITDMRTWLSFQDGDHDHGDHDHDGRDGRGGRHDRDKDDDVADVDFGDDDDDDDDGRHGRHGRHDRDKDDDVSGVGGVGGADDDDDDGRGGHGGRGGHH